MAPPFTVPCEGVKLGFYTVPTGNPNPEPYADKMLKANDFTLKHLQVVWTEIWVK